jgi:mannose-1-phosphate guanylyltransferase
MRAETWVIILAGGDGRRLHGVSRDASGAPAPKQYCDFGTGRPLIARALDRALALAPYGRVLCVVAESHREWWEPALDALPAENIVVQPRNRGTGPGILLPLLHVLARDPGAIVAFLPSDHHAEDEALLADAIDAAAREALQHPDSLVLIGMTPDTVDAEYGWVLPEPSTGDASNPVAAFVEKPVPAEAARLREVGALWNSFMFCGRADALAGMYEECLPWLLDEMRAALADSATDALGALYGALDTADFSREVLQRLPRRLRVQTAEPCGWTDLGTPGRIERVFEDDARRRRPAA